MKSAIHILTIRNATIGVLLLFSGFILHGQPGQHPGVSESSAQENLNTAKATMEAYETGDWEGLRSHLQDNAMVYGLGHYDSLTVDQTISYWSDGRKNAVPLLSDNGTWLNISQAQGEQKGEWVYHWGNNTISYENGESVTFPFHIALKMLNHKVIEAHFYYDNMKIIRAMGYALSPPLEEEQGEEVIELVEQP